jgi:predicted MFS family arabinose efflux permease
MPMVGASIFAALADYVPAPQRARMAGYVTSAAPIAFLAAMSMGVLAGGLVTWRLPVIGLAAIALAVAVGAWRLPPTPEGARTTGRVTALTYLDRLLSLSLDRTTRLLLLSYLAWRWRSSPSWASIRAGCCSMGSPAMGRGRSARCC